MRDAYDAIEWPILVMLGALIPVSEALRTTGGTELIAAWLSSTAAPLPAMGALALLLAAAMAVTPFLNNAATVLVMAPIAASFAARLGYNPDPFLMAVAIGAACDFLTPIGHQCNTLVMGPGGYRFGDYWRLGLPLSLIVLVRRRAADRLLLAGLALRRLGDLRRAALLDQAIRRRDGAGLEHVTAFADAHHGRHVARLEQIVACLQLGPEAVPFRALPQPEIALGHAEREGMDREPRLTLVERRRHQTPDLVDHGMR